ncbi:intradiol ring-cleavage dioxygenase [Flavobacterium sp. H122]|uniref:dioxygenase family protein n=1 Tax=Flavobacterium sp. H122 TaxID=2529860 RepID=UPI0010A9EC88|nr:intradiol ring-cleavage dioxygenase [Flavobacterium sp. H122]
MTDYIKKYLCVCILIVSLSCQQTISKNDIIQTASSVNQKDDCDNPDANINCCFKNMPERLTSTMVIPSNDSNGEKMVLNGTIYKKDKSTPYPNIILYAYHTDSKGEYSKKGNEKEVQKWHGSHYGWCKTDENGNYRIETIRPASYPGTTNPAHIHAAVKTQDKQVPFYITDFVFKDDPLLTKIQPNKFSYQGGTGVVDVKKVNNVWIGKWDIILN